MNVATYPISRTGSPVNSAASAPARSSVLSVAEHFPVSPITLGLDAVDLTTAAVYGLSHTTDSLQVLGGVLAGAHAITAFVQGMNALDDAKGEHLANKAFGQALLALGHLTATQGLGAWALPIMAAGFITSNLAEARTPRA